MRDVSSEDAEMFVKILALPKFYSLENNHKKLEGKKRTEMKMGERVQYVRSQSLSP